MYNFEVKGIHNGYLYHDSGGTKHFADKYALAKHVIIHMLGYTGTQIKIPTYIELKAVEGICRFLRARSGLYDL